MSDYDDITAELAFRLPGSALGAQQLELKNTLRDFCGRSNANVVALSFTTTPGTLAYDLSGEIQDGVATRLMNVVGQNGDPVPAGFTLPCTVTLVRDNASSQTMTANVALLPDVFDTDIEGSVPAWFWTQHHTTIVHGVLGRMMAHIAKPYTNPTMAKYHMAEYANRTNAARNEMLRKYSFRAQGWAFPQGGFVTSSQRGVR